MNSKRAAGRVVCRKIGTDVLCQGKEPCLYLVPGVDRSNEKKLWQRIACGRLRLHEIVGCSDSERCVVCSLGFLSFLVTPRRAHACAPDQRKPGGFGCHASGCRCRARRPRSLSRSGSTLAVASRRGVKQGNDGTGSDHVLGPRGRATRPVRWRQPWPEWRTRYVVQGHEHL